MLRYTIVLGAAGVCVLLVVWILSAKTLPPTTMAGHIEVSPPSHVMREPMDSRVFKHMLEHADGTGPPGVIISYDCERRECGPGLVENLESFANAYDFVYVAPYSNMKSKIVLTRLGRQLQLDGYSKSAIEQFIKF